MTTREVHSDGAAATEALGAALGRAVTGGELIGLVGDLGAGKTCLVRGLAAGLGVDPTRVHSPSFTIVNEYPGGRLVLQHADLYRLEGALGDALFLREVLYGEGVAAVEWFDRLPSASDDEALVVTLGFEPRGTSGDGRTIRLTARGARHERLLAAALGG